MNEGLIWLGAHRNDVLTVVMVVVVVFNLYALIRQQRTLVELRRLLLIARQSGIARRPMMLSNGAVGHRYNVMPRIIGGEGDEH